MSSARHVIVLGIDGLRPDMVSEKAMPTLAALQARGAHSLEHRTVFPSETRGALTALVCGARPETTGVLGNEFHTRDRKGAVTRTQTIHDWHEAEARLPGGIVTATGLAEVLRKAGKRLAVVTSGGQGSMTALSWGGRAHGDVAFNVMHPAIGHPHDLAAAIEQAHGVPPAGLEKEDVAAAVDVFTRTIWPARRPEAAILWLTAVDGASHRHGLGAPAMLASMAACDAALARLLEWRSALPERDDVAILVTSDHGHASIGAFADVDGALARAGVPLTGVTCSGARAPAFWLERPDDRRLAALVEALRATSWAGALFTRPAVPGDIEGRIAGTLSTALTGAAHPRSADLVVQLDGSEDANGHGWPGVVFCAAGNYDTPLGGGVHGGMHPRELRALLVGEGAGLRPTQAASRTGIQDVAPTLLHLLGVAPPATMTGRILHELLDDGGPPAAPRTETLQATTAGWATTLTLTTVAGAVYVDGADRAGGDRPPARRRDDLVVATAA